MNPKIHILRLKYELFSKVKDFKISLITVTYNAEATISRCIESVIAQNHHNLEYIIIDGCSTDNTLQIINQYKDFVDVFISEPDKGVYDAMNKGILNASGDIIGMLNADDFFADNNVLDCISAAFAAQETSIVFGDLHYINAQGKIIRNWKSNNYVQGKYNWGWMPPHPSFYCKRELFERFGFYSLDYGTAADYELMLRFMHLNKVEGFYLNKVLVKMQCGGMSNKNPMSRIKAWRFDLKAMYENDITFPLLTLFIKPLRKIGQYL